MFGLRHEPVRNALAILLSIEIVLTVALFSHMGHAGRAAIARASFEWHQHPTVETRRAFERQERISKIEQWAFIGLVWSVLGIGIVLIYRIRRAEPED